MYNIIGKGLHSCQPCKHSRISIDIEFYDVDKPHIVIDMCGKTIDYLDYSHIDYSAHQLDQK
jgi:hypothetical protein